MSDDFRSRPVAGEWSATRTVSGIVMPMRVALAAPFMHPIATGIHEPMALSSALNWRQCEVFLRRKLGMQCLKHQA